MFKDPEVGSQINIDGQSYTFTEAPNAPGIIYAEIGRKAKVYRVANGNQVYALKAFKPRYRSPNVVGSTERIAKFQDVPGLSVAKRLVLTPERYPDLIREHEAFAYGILMPWVEGKSWFNYVTGRIPLKREESLRLARALVNAVCELESRDLAHCDLSSSNFIFTADYSHVELIDIEEMFGYGLLEPEDKPKGTGGYAPAWVKEDGIWEAGADRFSMSILVSEILGWQYEDVRNASDGDAYFGDGEFGNKTKRFRLLSERLEQIHLELARLFKATWYAESVEECPKAADWKRVLDSIREPEIIVVPDRLDFGVLDLRQKPPVLPRVTLEVKNLGGGVFQGHVDSNVPWLTVTPAEFICQEGKSSKHTVFMGLIAPAVRGRTDYSFNDVIIIQGKQRSRTLSAKYTVVHPDKSILKWLVPVIASFAALVLLCIPLLFGSRKLVDPHLKPPQSTPIMSLYTGDELPSPTELAYQPTATSTPVRKPTIAKVLIPTATKALKPTATVFKCPNNPSSRLEKGEEAYVCTKGGNHLIIRLEPAPQGTVNEVRRIDTKTRLLILDGPVCEYGYIWWKVRTIDYGARDYEGWAREGYLEENPYFICPKE